MEEYLGMIKIFAGSYAPQGWLYCDGRTLDANRYANLFSLIGNMYGGDGMSNFKLPDLNGRVAIGASNDHHQATTGGSETITLAKNQMPAHSHNVTVSASVNVSDTVADTQIPTAGMSIAAPSLPQGREKGPINGYVSGDANIKLSDKTANVTVAQTTEGGSSPINLMQPFMAVNYIICVEGLYPPRP